MNIYNFQWDVCCISIVHTSLEEAVKVLLSSNSNMKWTEDGEKLLYIWPTVDKCPSDLTISDVSEVFVETIPLSPGLIL